MVQQRSTFGLTGSEHTRSNGYKYSSVIAPYLKPGLNEAGQVSGISYRYSGGSTMLGQSAWLYDGATTIDIGLTGAEHTRNDGYKVSSLGQPNEAGQVRGTSNRYNGGNILLGSSAWLYDGGAATIDVGLVGNEHTRNDGYKSSRALLLNEAGLVGGTSSRHNGGSTDLGQTAWLYDGATTTDIGLTGSEHTRNDGYKFSAADQMLCGCVQLNEAGQVIGRSNRYDGGSSLLGTSAWLYDGAATIDIGLTDIEHTASDGNKGSVPYQLNEAGQVWGIAYRYNGGSAYLGASFWLYNGVTTIHIGLTGPEHTRYDGYKNGGAQQLNEAGHVRGTSDRFNGGSTDMGRSAWLYNAATTIDVGLTGGEHTRNDGYKLGYSEQLNQAGQIIGGSSRYNGGSIDLGNTAWLYDGANTIDIGLTGSEHIRNSGYKYSSAQDLNEAGQVRGSSYRYNGGSTQLGQDAWLYDPQLDQTIALQFSTRSDGYAFSTAAYLGEDGLVLGSYTLFDALDTNLGSRAFYFTISDGMNDLGPLVEGGLAANGWDYLATAIRANGLARILGHGKLTSQSGGQMAYLLTPAVPEPSALAIAATCTVLLLGHNRRRRRSEHL